MEIDDSKKQSRYIKLIEKVNEGDEKIISTIILHFGDIGKFIAAMIKIGLIEYIDPFSYELSEYQNEIFYAFYKKFRFCFVAPKMVVPKMFVFSYLSQWQCNPQICLLVFLK
jgi:hypothetical protein